MSYAATLALLGLLSFAPPGNAQEVEIGPRPTVAGPAAPGAPAASGAPQAGTAGAAVQESDGPLGAAVVADDGVPARAPADIADGESAPAEAAAGDAGLLGAPVSRPMPRSFMPAVHRAADGRAPVDALGTTWGLVGEAFREEQLTHSRVVDAQLAAKFELKALFAERGLTWPPRQLYFRLFKQEQVLEVWVRDAPGAERYTLLREYAICAVPGRLGPKTRIDDYQAPEGFYYIQGFNPESEFHLSLRLNYPNAADRILGVTDAWGGDIYIHGGCSTVGCFPMTDEAMQELYWLAVEARTAGQAAIPVHVFPARMDGGNMRWLSETFERDQRLLAFWENLRDGYAYFEEHRRLPAISVDARGRYLFDGSGAGAGAGAVAGAGTGAGAGPAAGAGAVAGAGRMEGGAEVDGLLGVDVSEVAPGNAQSDGSAGGEGADEISDAPIPMPPRPLGASPTALMP